MALAAASRSLIFLMISLPRGELLLRRRRIARAPTRGEAKRNRDQYEPTFSPGIRSRKSCQELKSSRRIAAARHAQSDPKAENWRTWELRLWSGLR
jgi:hypothetical protein